MKKTRTLTVGVLAAMTVLFFVFAVLPYKTPAHAELALPEGHDMIQLITADSTDKMCWGDNLETTEYSYEEGSGASFTLNCQPSALVGMGQILYGEEACDQTYLSFTATLPQGNDWAWNYVVFRGGDSLDDFIALAFRKGGGHITMLSRVGGTWYSYADTNNSEIIVNIPTVKNCELGTSEVLSGLSGNIVDMEIHSSSDYVRVYAEGQLIYQSALTIPLPSATGIFVYTSANSSTNLALSNVKCETFHEFGEWQDEVSAGIGTAGSVGHKDCAICNRHFDENGAVIEDITVPALTGIKYMSISAEGDIGLNYYVYVGEYDGTPAATFSVGGQPAGQAEGIYVSGLDCYVFTYGVAAKDYKDEVTITVDGTDITGSSSVEKYAEQIGTDDPAYEIVTDLISYCEAARIYFGGEQTVAAADIEDDLSAYAAEVSGSDSAVNLKGATIVLESKLGINVYFTSDDTDGITFTADGVAVTPEKVEGENNLYVLKIDDIVAKDINRTYSLKIGGYTVNYSVLSYVEEVLSGNSGDAALCNTLKALYALSVTADNYFAE